MDETNDVFADALRKAQKALVEGRARDADHIVSEILSASPAHIDALYIKAVAARYLSDLEGAHRTLGQLMAFAPEFGRAHQEAGHVAKARGDHKGAQAAYRLATQYNPALLASWQALTQDPDPALAAMATAQVARLQALPKPLVTVTNLIHEGKLVRAEDLCRAYLQQHPKDVEGMRLLADIGARLNILDDADFLLESALAFEPDNIQCRLDYIQVLRKRQRYDTALQQAEILHTRDPENPLFLSHLAIESMQVGDYDRSFALFDQVLEKLPRDPATLTSKGHALKTYGRNADAVAAYHAAIDAAPDHADAYYALANLKTYRFTDKEIAAMGSQIDAPGQPSRHLVHFHFALGKAHEDRQAYEAAFSHYQQGNELKRRQSRYDADQMDAEFTALKDACTPALFDAHAGHGAPAPDPIFILGLPRAGSTLLEQILASHSQVDGTMEMPNILSLAHRLRTGKFADQAKRYPANLHDLPAEALRAFGEDYIEKTRIHRQGAPFFIDKMPNNFRHIGLIQLILPNARIIDARRAPMDCCFSGFKQLFAEGQEFTYGLEPMGRYYRGYVDLMRHWHRVLPQKILHVQYEDVVEDLETQVRRILDFCNLPFEQACVDFHQTDRSVRTASSEQVRQPLYRSGMDQWRPFEPWLGPLKDALGPTLTEFRK